MKKRLCAALCLAAALLTLLVPWSLAAGPYDGVYLIGVNHTVLLGLISNDLMPVRRSGTIYAPYTVLDNKELNLSYALNRTGGTFTIFNRKASLIFQLNSSGAADKEGNEYSNHIITRNDVVFIPLRFVASFFDLRYSFYNLSMPDGSVPIARVCSDGAVLSDTQFGPQAAQLAAGPLNQYMAAQATPSPSAAPSSAAPAPSPSAAPRAVDICFAVTCGDGGGFQTTLDAFRRAGVSALYLFSPDDLLLRDQDVRAAAAAGHQIGLLLPGQEAEDAFRRGNELLRHILRCEATQVAFSGDRPETQEGWWVWNGNVTPQGRSVTAQARSLSEEVDGQRVARVTLNDSRVTAQALQRALPAWTQRPYTLFTPTE